MDPVTAFVMAVIALILTALNISVTIAVFSKTAGRVRVQMNASILDPARSLVSNDTGSWGIGNHEFDTGGIEAVKITIENPGRIGATISKVELRIEGSKDPDLALVLEPLEVRHWGKTSASAPIYRLEPFDEVIYLFDFWQTIDYVFDSEPDLQRVRVYASVKVAGQDGLYVSTKRGYWIVRRDWVSFRPPYTKRRVESVVLSELMSIVKEPANRPYIVGLSASIAGRLSPESSAIEITEILQGSILFDKEGAIAGEGPDVWSLLAFGSRVKHRINSLGDRAVWQNP